MMRKIVITITVLLVAIASQAQFNYPIATPTWYKKLRVDDLFWLNTVDTVHSDAVAYPGALCSRTTAGDTALYLANGTRWVRIASGTSAGSSIDSVRRSNDTLYFRKTTGGELAVAMDMYTKTQLQTSGQSAVHWGNLTNIPTNVATAVPSSRTLTLTSGTGISVTGGTQDLSANRTWTINNTGVTSVGLSLPSVFSVTGSPVTTAGTLTAAFAGGQTANRVLATPDGATGALSLRAMVAADIPNLDAGKITTGIFPVARGGTGLGALGIANQLMRTNAGATAIEWFTPNFLTANQNIILSGDVIGSGTTAITTTLANAGTAGTYTKVTTDAKGRVISGTTLASGDIPAGSGNYIQNQLAGAQSSNFWISGSGRITGTADIGNASLVRGTGTGINNVSYLQFMESNGTTRNGYVGDGSAGSGDINVVSDLAGISLVTGGTSTLYATAAGNVGIGTTTPGDRLNVVTPGGADGVGIQSTLAFGGGSGAFLRLYNSGTPSAANQRMGGILWGANPTGTTRRTGAQIEGSSEAAWTDNVSHPTYLRFLTVPSGSTTVTERMRITADGGVGIGTTAPAFEGLHLMKTNANLIAQSTTAYSSTSGGLFQAYNSGTPSAANQRLGAIVFGSIPTGTMVRPSAQIDGISAAAWTDGVSQPSYLSFLTTTSGSTDPNERMRITQNGDVGIGKTPSGVMLDVAGAGNFDGSLSIGAGAANITGLGNASFPQLTISGNATFLSGIVVTGTTNTTKLVLDNPTAFVTANAHQLVYRNNTTEELEVNSGALVDFVTIAASQTLNNAEHYLKTNSTAYTLTVPSASANQGRRYTISNSAGTTLNITVNVTTNTQTIDGSGTNVTLTPGTFMTIVSNGIAWFKVGG